LILKILVDLFSLTSCWKYLLVYQSHHIYGLGQQRNDFKLDMNWKKITLFNHDQHPKTGTNLYGSHPFYLAMEESGDSSGVMLLNSNAMDIDLTPAPGITYRTIGGLLDFYIFLGPSPSDVIRQFTSLVGRPFLPPYWSLGFHLSSQGYEQATHDCSNTTLSSLVDTQWNDRDYMKNNNDFTYDNESFNGLPDFVDMLHKVWNKKYTVYVDFFKRSAVDYWLTQLRRLHEIFAFDGTGLDMNDPTNFLNDSGRSCPNVSLEYPHSRPP
ncbi:lysosomal alpha-glucosidase-like, partial [Homalodisca vitripennis]|uniref:lysosomal alpha-glucosidase-like n=1 Tax=Homalodisca vitripennis TaxID=197043 RepID=UPI001EEA9501